jgi:hypothetical protein
VKLDALTASKVLFTDANKNITTTGIGTSAQFLKGDGSLDSTTYISLSALSANSPLSYNSGTGVFSIQQANTSQNGFISSTDWNTFNNKFTLPSLTSGSVLFSNGTTIVQDNTNFFWDNTNKRLGIENK